MVSKPDSMCQCRLREEAEMWGRQRQTEERVAAQGPVPDTESTCGWAWEREGAFGLEGPTAAQGTMRLRPPCLYPVLCRDTGLSISLPLRRLCQDKRLSCQPLRMLRPREVVGRTRSHS